MTAPCPDCAQDCGCRVDTEPERAELGVGAHPGEPVDVTEEEMREFIVACDGPQGVSDEEAAEWERLAAGATEGPWVVDQDGSIGAPMAGLVCGEAGHPRPDCSECGTRVCHTSVMPGEPDAAFIAAARTAVPRLLADRERLMDALADEAKVAEVGKAFHRLVVAERDFERGKNDRLRVQRDGLRATVRSMLGDAAAEGRCGCVALCEGPQEDCPLHGRDYAWWVGLAGTACADREWLMAENARMRQVAELRVGTWRDTAARLEGERDRARGTAATLEAENARLTEALYLTRITLEATFRVLQEASGLPDDIDDPDCRDEMVLALRPRAEKAEAENARLREGIERLATEMQRGRLIPGTPVFGCAACGMPNESEACEDHDEGLQHAGDMLRAMLAEGGE